METFTYHNKSSDHEQMETTHTHTHTHKEEEEEEEEDWILTGTVTASKMGWKAPWILKK